MKKTPTNTHYRTKRTVHFGTRATGTVPILACLRSGELHTTTNSSPVRKRLGALRPLICLAWAALLLPARLPAEIPAPNGPGQALSLGGVNDYLTVPHNAALNAYPLTISAWVRTSRNEAKVDGIISKYMDASYNGYSLFLYNGHVGGVYFKDINNRVFVDILGLDGGFVANDAWHHVALVVDAAGGRIVVDGEARASLAWSALSGSPQPGPTTTTAPLQIGRYHDYPNAFSGQLDDVRIWNVALTTNQIQETMRRQLFGNESGLVAYYRLDEGAGLNAFDATGNAANTATLVNGPVWVDSGILPFAPNVAGSLDAILTSTSARLAGTGSANNSPTLMSFQWGLTTNYGSMTPPVDFGSGTIPGFWKETLSGLTPGATYHARAAGTNAHGASYGTDFTFTTPVPTNIVLNTDDSGYGSLREVIRDLTPGDTVRFSPEVTNAILLTSGEIVINRDLTILGPGADRLSLRSTGQVARVFLVATGHVRISDLSLIGGRVFGTNGASTPNPAENGAPGGDAEGGGILNYGDLTLTDCMVQSCVVSGGTGGTGGPNFGIFDPGAGGAGGAARGAGICNRGTLTLLRCTLADNLAFGGSAGTGGEDGHLGATPGGIGGPGGVAAGGGIYNAGTLFTMNSTLVSNVVTGGYGGRGGTGIPGGGHGGGGGNAYGAGTADEGVEATLVCDTIHGNRSVAGMGGPGGTGSSYPGGDGIPGGEYSGGLYHHQGWFPFSYVRSTLIAGNVAATGSDVAGGFTSGGYNLIGTLHDGGAITLGFTNVTDRVAESPARLDPRLGILGYLGGTTLTLLPQPGSPALDAGDDTVLAAPRFLTSDQRGGRRRAGSHVDIGAVEVGGLLRVTAFRDAGVRFDITFTTESGWPHHLESQDALSASPWEFVPGSSTPGNGDEITVFDTRPRSPASRFYRAVIAP